VRAGPAAVTEPIGERVGQQAVALARESLRSALSRRPPRLEVDGRALVPDLDPAFEERRGVFVTLHAAEERLRGCVGFVGPHYPLREGIPRAAISAGLDDPRFPPVERGELAALTIEVSILTPPRALVAPRRVDLPKLVRLGVDGLIVEAPGASGLLLPQVAPQFGFSAEEFLAETCLKADLPPDAWLRPETRVLAFESQVFRETAPEGPVPAREP
jgi:uncharacterized protein (TIGR00296 family)